MWYFEKVKKNTIIIFCALCRVCAMFDRYEIILCHGLHGAILNSERAF